MARRQAQNQRKTHWHEDRVIEIADDWDEIGNEVERTVRIADDAERWRLRVPWHTRIARSQVARMGVSLEAARPALGRL
jgi:hypothetical protein